MKKIAKIIICSLCMVWLIGMHVSAAGSVIFHVENQSGKKGDIIEVLIEFDSGEEVGGFDIKVFYDPEVMEFKELQKGDLITEEEGLFDYNHKEEEAAIKIIYVVADTVKADGTIVNLKFELKKDCVDEAPIGVGIDEVIDNGEESKEISGTVSGVNEEFQKEVEKKMEKKTEVVEEKTGETRKKEEVETEESKKESGDEKTVKITKGEKEQEQKSDEGKKENGIVFLVCALVMMASVLAIVAIIRKKK